MIVWVWYCGHGKILSLNIHASSIWEKVIETASLRYSYRCPNLCGITYICGRTIERYIDLFIDTLLMRCVFLRTYPSSLFTRAVFSKTSTAHSTSHSHYLRSVFTARQLVMTTKNIVLRIINWNPQPIDHLLRLDLVGYWEIIHK